MTTRSLLHLAVRSRVLNHAHHLGAEENWEPLDLLVETALGRVRDPFKQQLLLQHGPEAFNLRDPEGNPVIKPHPYGLDPVLADKQPTAAERVDAAKELVSYMYPKLKAVEHVGGEEPINVRLELVRKIGDAAARLAERAGPPEKDKK